MFRIRRIFDDILPANAEALHQVRQILQDQFPALRPSEIDKLPDLLKNPLKHRFKSILYVAENFKGLVKGFALLSFEPELRFCYLDYISTAKNITGGGIGGALYERLREEALLLGAVGIFFECLPDDPGLCQDPGILKQNRARLKFYEKYGAFPIVGTAYETPVKEGDDNPPYLVFDPLGRKVELARAQARKIVRSILENRYGDLCSPEYILKVVESFEDDPVRLRAPRYLKTERIVASFQKSGLEHRQAALVVNDRHEIHHVRERGYVEAPVRIRSILKELERLPIFTAVTPKEYPEKHILAVHDPDYVRYFRRVCAQLEPGKSVYPYVFPIRNAARPPKELAVRAGYYCIDTFTPLNQNAYLAAKRAVDCALTAADHLLAGNRLAYALVRPPGHHAEYRAFGGFCYFNNAAVAAHYLSRFGRVAILDVDYHHGNGQQNIFYQRRDVLTLSIHGHPSFAYPYFSGFEEETGEGAGEGFNLNMPLPEAVDGEKYLKTLARALKKIAYYAPDFLIVCLGLDTAKGDPTGTWTLNAADFSQVGQMIGRLRLPTVVVQEGGYRNRVLGVNCRSFFTGLWQGLYPDVRS
ncbi:MAG: histone deacetylase family protein [Desulfuromonadales bacterium]|nr:histone deacetylase family protein [Desulfuromonadales bacterium]MDW7756861.1 histone deacetylase family protein [Desulfuromonadales bacterium]